MLTVFVIVPMAVSAFTTAPFAYAVQTVSRLSPETDMLPAGTAFGAERDVVYSDAYPGSVLDILYADETNAPTFLFIHGGGHLLGSKTDEDCAQLIETVRQAGYHVVSVEYELMPDAPFPLPVRQITEAMRYLQEHGEEYGLDMGRTILMGQSSGAALALQYAAAVTNRSYAEALGLGDISSCPVPRAVIADDPPLDTKHMPWHIKLVICNYIAGRTVLTDGEANLYDAAIHFSDDMPPCFLIGSFVYRHDAERIAALLGEAGTVAEVYNPYTLYRIRKRHCFINSAGEDSVKAEATEKLLGFAARYAAASD